MILTEEEHDDYLAHYGILRRSGRYPWGSGEDQPTRNRDFLQTIDSLKKQGMTDDEIRQGFSTKDYPITAAEWRDSKSRARAQQKAAQQSQAQRLRDTGMSHKAIAEEMGLPGESSVRALLAPGATDTHNVLVSTSDMLRREVADKKYIDIGAGNESYINQGISRERLRNSVAMLQDEGYEVHKVKVPQIGTTHDTEFKVLAAPGTPWKEVHQNRLNIQRINAVTEDGGRHFTGPQWHDPISINSNRIQVKYAEDGGSGLDGVIHVRPGVEDISLGQSRYAQVRVKVDGTHYLKGMALYKDDLPPGTDLVFHTAKSRANLGPNKLDAMKPLEKSEEYPFKTVVRQQVKNIGLPDEHVTSAMNIVNEQGQWKNWSKSLSSQFLSKQSPTLAKTQLNMTYEHRQKDFDDIMSLTNPTVRKKLLENFAEGTDAASVHLSAAALSTRQRWHAILPLESIKPTEIYAPNYDDGERVVLIRHPHAGTFEIPELTVNNKQPEGRRLIGPDAQDAVGIHHSVAEHLSGADFDGDTVIVIPNNPGSRKRVTISPMLEQLKGFDPKSAYPKYEGMTVISPGRKQQEMGQISNLITDMTIKGAPNDEVARAVKHSMVIIDAEKHELNYKQSAIDNGISQLKAKYQRHVTPEGKVSTGASTLISKSESEMRVPHRKARLQGLGGPVDPVTGEKRYQPTNLTTVNKKGDVIPKTTMTTKGAETNDAYTLSSGTIMESVYADHSNKLKALANTARLEALNTPPLQRNASAKRVYGPEVESLNAKLILAKKNAVLERHALAMAQASIKAKREAYPELDGDALKKIRYEEQKRAREATGAKKKLIEIEPKEWDAIQAGAISNTHLIQILNNADIDKLRDMATPRKPRKMSTAMTQRAKAMLAAHYTRAEVAKQLGVSVSTIDESLKGKEQTT